MRYLNKFKINTSNNKHYLFIDRIINTERISVLEAISYIISFWKIIIYPGIFFILFSVFLSFLPSQKTFVSRAVITPDDGAFQKLSIDNELTDLLSISPSINSSSKLGIETFPVIMDYYPFLLTLLEEKIYSENYGKYISIGEYIMPLHEPNMFNRLLYKIESIPNKIFKIFESRSDDLIDEKDLFEIPNESLNEVTAEQLSLIKLIPSHIKVESKRGSVTIETELPEAKTSTRLNNLVLDKLINEVSRLKTARQRRNLQQIKKQLDSVKKVYEISQLSLAKFADSNKGNNSASFNVTLQRLSSEFNLHSALYSKLALEFETSKIELIENTPFFEIVEPAYISTIPLESGFNLRLIKPFAYGVAFGIFVVFIYTFFLVFIKFRDKLNGINF